MKVGVHLSMLCKTWQDDVSGHLEKLKEGGFDSVEISMFGVERSHLGNVAKKAQSLGLDISFGTGITSETDISSSDPSVRKAGVSYLKECCNFANDIGAKFINGVIYAPWQGFSKEPRTERYKRSSSCLQEVSDSITGDFRLHCEVINRFETDFINTLDEGVDFLKLVDRKNVKLLVDTFHMNIEEDSIVGAMDKHYNDIGCVHICENHRGVPGTGHIPFADIISFLKEKEYKGYLIMESFVESGTEVGDGLFIWRKSKPPLEEALRGCSYIKKIIEG